MTTVSTLVQNRFACGSSSVNGSTPRIETQITYLRPKRSPIGPPTSVPSATAPRKHEQMDLRALRRDVEFLDQIERVDSCRGSRGRNTSRRSAPAARRSPARFCRAAASRRAPTWCAPTARDAGDCVAYQPPTAISTTIASSAATRKPRDAALAVRQHDERREQRAERRAEVAADLEHRLREAVPSARRHARDARGFRMEHRRPMPTSAAASSSHG